MTPKLTYKIIINNAKKRINDIKGQWHHIKPRCMNGTDEAKNLVKLTYKEHFFCHYLLTKIYPNNKELRLAYYMMSNICGRKISAKHYDESTKMALEYIGEKTSERNLKKWKSSKRDYKIGKKKVTYREYMTYKLRNADRTRVYDKTFQLNCNKSKCLRFMWRYLSTNKITEDLLTDDIIKKGWKSRKGYQSNTWRKFYKSFKSWKNALLDYLKENPIDINYTYKHKKSSRDQINQRQRTRMLHDFERIWKEGRFVNNDYITAKYHYALDRSYRVLNWKKYFTKKEWVEKVKEIIDNQ